MFGGDADDKKSECACGVARTDVSELNFVEFGRERGSGGTSECVVSGRAAARQPTAESHLPVPTADLRVVNEQSAVV